MLSTFIIALREGLEAALIVGILVAYLVKSDQRSHLRALWSGVALAVTASLAFGAFLSYTSAELTTKGEKQAVRMAAWLDRHLPEGVRILVSPARRTEQTAKALNRKYKLRDELVPDSSAD